jgi:apolipoprotein N-acyltransferase
MEQIKKTKFNKLHIFGIITLIVAIIEIILCFMGPIAFIPKPSLVLFPVISSTLTDEESNVVTDLIEREFAFMKSYAIVSQNFIKEFYVRTDPDFDTTKLQPENYTDAHEIARELDMDRFATASVYNNYYGCNLSVNIRDVRNNELITSHRFTSDNLENLLKGIGKDGEKLNFQENLKNNTKGITFTDYLILGLLLIQLSIGLLALFGKNPGILIEIAWASALILFLFAYIHAQSANMDYMQRFIASKGMINLAKSTALEELYTILRFGPILLLNGIFYVYQSIQKNREVRISKKHWLYSWVSTWALPWVVISAVLFALSFPSIVSLEGFGILAWISLVPMFLVLLTKTPVMGIFYGTVFGVLQALFINYWHGTYRYITLHLITIAFFVQFLVFMTFLVLLIKASGKWGFLITAAAWVVFDFVRSIGILAYPWGIIGTTQYQFLPLIQIASITGVWGVSFIILLCNASLAWAIAAQALGWKWPGRENSLSQVWDEYKIKPYRRFLNNLQAKFRFSRFMLPIVVFLAVFLVSMVIGSSILRTMNAKLYDDPETPSATVVLIQQNTDPRKHDYKENLQILMDLTDEAINSLPEKPDLVAWPEGGTELDLTYWTKPERQNTYWGKVIGGFVEYQKNIGTWLLSGTQDHIMEPLETGKLKRVNYNSSVLIDPQGNIMDFFHKMRLVPFSERFPLDKVKFSGLYELFQTFNISNWGVGEKRLVFQHEKMRFATPICFEDVFSDHVRRFVLQDVDIILNISNDYWSLSPVEGRQHGILALFRAVENQRPLLRSTSSGYTVYIDATGRIHPGSPEPYTAGYTVAKVPLPEKKLTFYTKWGDWFPIFCGIAAGIAILILIVIRGLKWLVYVYGKKAFMHGYIKATNYSENRGMEIMQNPEIELYSSYEKEDELVLQEV